MLKKLIPFVLFALTAAVFSAVPAHAQATPLAAAKKESPWEAMFPDGLIKAGAKAESASKNHFKTMKGKFVGVYSSASWCMPCRKFTPELVKFYKKNKKDIEIVFRSGDKTEDAMIGYARKDKMKWLAVPFKKRCLSKGAAGIPHLVIYAPDGELFAELSGAGTKTFDALKKIPELMKEWRQENRK